MEKFCFEGDEVILLYTGKNNSYKDIKIMNYTKYLS